MKSPLIPLTFCLAAIVLASGPGATMKKNFHGYQVLRVNVESDQQATFLRELEATDDEDDGDGIDFWTDISVGRPADVMVSPSIVNDLVNKLEVQGFSYTVMIDDVQALIDEQGNNNSTDDRQSGFDFDRYNSLDDIYALFDLLEATNADVTMVSIGQSYEGRDMRILKICRDGCGDKPAMWIQAGIHAREWIGPATAAYLAYQLTNNLSATNEDLVAKLDWYILPSVNPDGYQFTQDADRMWRKTRGPTESAKGCVGVDANRNYDLHWDEGFSSASYCNDTYRGPQPFSEIENRNIRDYILDRPGQFRFFNDLHCYGQLVSRVGGSFE